MYKKRLSAFPQRKTKSFLFCIKGCEKVKFKFNTRWIEKKLECACLFGNPGCDRFRKCEVLEFIFKPFDDIKECIGHDSYKRHRGAIKQANQK